MLDDAVAVGGVGELESQDLRVSLGLLKTVARGPIHRFRFNDRDGKIAAIAQKVIGALLRTPESAVARKYDAAVREPLLLADLRVLPARVVQLREDRSGMCRLRLRAWWRRRLVIANKGR
jgi:hypothetical protein